MLAEISIPCTYSPRAVFCVVGIIYFLICAGICFQGVRGWLTVLTLFLIGLVILGFLTPSTGEFGTRGIESFTEETYLLNPPTYYMHNLSNPNRISPWIFHPGCIWQAPLIVFILGIFAFGTGAGKRREY